MPELNVPDHPHATDAAQVVAALAVKVDEGLSEDEAATRRAFFGANMLPTARPRSAWRLLLDQFLSLIVALLAAAAVVAWATGDYVDAAAIGVVIIFNSLIGFATEWQAARALDALRRQARTVARVRRGGRESLVNAEELVPGDVVVLNAGDRVPADVRVIEAASLRAEESALTGESVTVEKTAQAVSADALLAERRSMLYLGTTITAGRAVAVVTATGAATELGKIGKLVAAESEGATPLEERLAELGRQLVYLVLAIAFVVFVAGLLHGDSPWLMAEVAISLAVAAVPEALPTVTTLSLALGVLRMVRERAIVRRLPAVETLGSTTVICTDKTGTLTENHMAVREYRLADGQSFEVDGASQCPPPDSPLHRALLIGVLCNEAAVDDSSTEAAEAIGDPTETALLDAARRCGMKITQERARHPKLAEHPFDAATKRMLTVHRLGDGQALVALKGAPGAVLPLCDRYAEERGAAQPLDAETRARLFAVNDEMASRALRVLALAEKTVALNGSALPAESELEGAFTFLGFVGMSDPPRAEVKEAIRQARGAGIRVVMLTGDQLHTAQAIAEELELSGDSPPRVLHARALERADPARLGEMARQTDVFARVSPEDKLLLVAALQAAGEIVAVTGDGVNDAPALKRADIGIAMGLRGTEAAKEAADIVLADDNFATIVKAVAGGRTIYANIIKFVHLMFSKNLAAVIAIFAAMVLGWPLMLLPLQILWLNLVTDVFPALALALEPSEPDVMRRRPRSPQATLLSREFLTLILWQGVMLALIMLAAYGWALKTYGEGAHARTVALLALVGVQLGHLFNCRSRTRSAFEGLWRNPFVWAAFVISVGLQLLAVYFTPLARVLGTVRMNAADWFVWVLVIIAPVLIVEAVKRFAPRLAAGE